MSAATEIPSPLPPNKLSKQQVVLPSHLKTAKPDTKSALTNEEKRLANKDLTEIRTEATAYETVRKFRKASPNLSAACTAYVRMALTTGYTAIAYNLDGTVNPEGSAAVANILANISILNDYTIGYDDAPTLRSACESWAYGLLDTGTACSELVLDKTLLPYKMQPIAYQQIKLFPSADGRRLIPWQQIGSETISLDIPTFFMVHLDKDPLLPYSESPIESAVQAVLASEQFMNDLRRVVRRAIHPRYDVAIDEEKFRKTLPPEVANDQEKLVDYLDSVITELEDTVNGLQPEEALVHFDTIGVQVVDHGNTNLSNEYQVLSGMHDARMRAGAKVMPAVVGASDGTSNVASTETLMFVKYVEGAIQAPLNELLSKQLTLAARLLGHDVYVQFKWKAINLKPEVELETFAALKQSRVRELLSDGFMTDEEAAIELTGHLPPAGFKPLSGTGFFSAPKAGVGDGQNGATNGGSTLNQNLKPTTPTGGARGQNKKAEVIPLGAAT